MRKTICLFVALTGLTLAGCDSELTNRMVPHAHEFDATAMLIMTFGLIAGLLAFRSNKKST